MDESYQKRRTYDASKLLQGSKKNTYPTNDATKNTYPTPRDQKNTTSRQRQGSEYWRQRPVLT
jgi:hypothetical protein